MSKNIRRILFWLLFLLFLTTAPVAILYSQGYRFDQSKMIFVHSGAITVKSVPASVNIYLNGKLQPAKALDVINSSMTVGGLRPGSYHIKASLEGYSEWEKSVEVHSGLSTEFWNVVLAPNNPTPQEIESRSTARFFPSPFGKKIAFLEDLEGSLSLWITDFKKNKTNLAHSEDNVSFSKDRLDNVEWNFKEEMMLVPVTKNNRRDYLIASIDENFKPIYLSEISRFELVSKARWSLNEKNKIYFLGRKKNEETSNLYQINLADNAPQLIMSEVVTYDLSRSSVYYIQKNNMLFKIELDGGNASQINDTQFTDQPIGADSRLIVYDDERQALISQDGQLFVHNSASQDFYQKIADGVEGIQFSDDGKKMLFWNSNEISVMFLRKWDVQPYREENEIQTIIRLSTPLENVFWYRDYEHIFFSVKNKIKLIELDPRDHRICLDVFENNLEDFPAVYDTRNGYYYFVRESGGDKKIFYFTLPKKTGIFG